MALQKTKPRLNEPTLQPVGLQPNQVLLTKVHPSQANLMHQYYLRNKTDFEHWSSDFSWILNFEFGWERLLKQRAKACDQDRALHWVVLSAAVQQQIIGSINLIAMGSSRDLFNLGYAVDMEWRRRGVMSLALRHCLQEAFHVLPLHEIEACCQPENTASYKLLKGLGFANRLPPQNEKHLLIQGRLRKHLCMMCDRSMFRGEA